MNEPAKTLAFVAAGILAMAAAFFVDYGADAPVSESLINKTLSPEIDVSEPKRLQVIKFDRATAEVRKFEVAEVDGVWSLPSKEDYPADATEQMASAVTGVMGRKILRIAGETGDTHEKYGVVDPLSPKLNSKSAGVGTRVIISDADDNTLIDLIIGKAVKDSPGQRFVRSKQQNIVYVVEIDPSSLSTDFENWIEDDLLKLDTFALSRVFINDYSADLSIGMSEGRLVPQITRERRGEITLSREGESGPWQVAAMKRFDADQRNMVDDAVGAEEEVDQDAVGKLVSGLDDLLIVDVARKPAGLSADLKAGEAFLSNQEAVSDLVDKGFLPGRLESGADMLSSEGEVVCTLNNGVEYILRFGQLRVQTESADGGEEADEAAAEEAAPADDDAKEPAEGKAADGKDADGAAEGAEGAPDDAKEEGDAGEAGENLRRYLFVMARFNESAVPKPELKDLPELPADAATAAEGDAAAGDDAAADDAATEEGEADADGDDAATDDAATDEAASDEDATDEGEEAADGEDSKDKPDAKAIMAERKKIEEENQRLMDEYQSALAAGEKTVGDLNVRFGDWYFVISNDVYKQIHLGRGQVIKKKEAKADEAAADDGTAGLPQLPGATAIEEATESEGADEPTTEAAPAGDDAAGAPEGEQDAAATEEPEATEPAATEEAAATQPQ